MLIIVVMALLSYPIADSIVHYFIPYKYSEYEFYNIDGASGVPFMYKFEGPERYSDYFTLVNQFTKTGNFVFFTYTYATIGHTAHGEGWCYRDNKMYLGKINLENNVLTLDMNDSNEIYDLRHLFGLDGHVVAWFSDDKNKC